mmetsp:Transcript_10923/g.20908  ORF Transcript_10923/g.20908 Transcript_10923/m.20908 type:complete len:519 (-) Transcript_10923:343-1899(-)
MQTCGAVKNLGRDSLPHALVASSAEMLIKAKSAGGFGNALKTKDPLFSSDSRLLKLFGTEIPLPGQLASQKSSSAGATTVDFQKTKSQNPAMESSKLETQRDYSALHKKLILQQRQAVHNSRVHRASQSTPDTHMYRGIRKRPGSMITKVPIAKSENVIRYHSPPTSMSKKASFAEYNSSKPNHATTGMDMKKIQALTEELKAEVNALTGGSLPEHAGIQKVNAMAAERTTPENYTDVSKKEADVLPALAALLQEPTASDSDATDAEPSTSKKKTKKKEKTETKIIPSPPILKTSISADLPTIEPKFLKRSKSSKSERSDMSIDSSDPGTSKGGTAAVSRFLSMKRRRVFNRARRACARCHKRKIRCNPNPIHGAARPCASCLDEGRTDCVDYMPPQSAASAASNKITGSPPRRKPKALADYLNRHRGTRCKRNPNCTRPHKHPGHCKDPSKKLQKFVGRFVKKRKRCDAQSYSVPQATPMAVQPMRPAKNHGATPVVSMDPSLLVGASQLIDFQSKA